VPARDGYVVTALRRAGAIIIGQTTTPEFAHTLVTDSPLWGTTRNPHALDRTPGGSSGGSAAAVAAGCVPLAEGSRHGRLGAHPGAWCGVVGLKPGLGRIPMDVLPGLFDSISHHGPLARCADDARLFLAATQGPTTPTSCRCPGRSTSRAARRRRDAGCGSGSRRRSVLRVDPEIAAAVTPPPSASRPPGPSSRRSTRRSGRGRAALDGAVGGVHGRLLRRRRERVRRPHGSRGGRA
jgi:amidase/aspartyl-tRNA(Asn)/glutamyl-tRNA(Gln) amidotransferase subunit A